MIKTSGNDDAVGAVFGQLTSNIQFIDGCALTYNSISVDTTAPQITARYWKEISEMSFISLLFGFDDSDACGSVIETDMDDTNSSWLSLN